jgi:hypothetical protein
VRLFGQFQKGCSRKPKGLRAKREPGLFKFRPSSSLSLHLAYG